MGTTDYEHRKEELWALLSRRVGLWTGMDHSSVTAERAQQVLDSLLFTLAMGEEATAGSTALAVGQVPLADTFARGQRRIRAKRKTALTLWRRAMGTAPPTKNRCYHETLYDGMAAFFRHYEPEFAAHEHIITCDYPLAVPVEGEQGVALIVRYLEQVCLENEFCAYFPAAALSGLWRRRGLGADAVDNLFQPVLSTALGAVLLGENPAALAPTAEGVRRLQQAWLIKTKGEIDTLVAGALTDLTARLGLEKPPLLRYLTRAAQGTAAELALGVEHLCLGRVLA